MAELNEQDPITGRKLPRLVNNTGQEPIDPTKSNTSIQLPKVRYNNYTPGVQLVDYTKSKYDNPGGTYIEDLPQLESIRAKNQGVFSTLGNGIGRVLVNTIPTVIGNVASMLDLEDYYNRDNEVGNSITRAMEDFKSSVNQDYLPIYRENPGKSFDIYDSAWWIENGSSLTESIAAFAITGAGIGAGINALGKGLSMINGLSKLGQAGKAAATILSATGLNQAESITTAMEVYDQTYKTALENGQDEETAKQSAADAASYSININRANIALNLTSAGAFIRNPKMTRQIREAFTGQGRKEIFGEGLQEYGEETINYIAQKEGERYGKAKSKGKDYSFDLNNAISDALSLEGIESGVLGFLGGFGQTALTRKYNKMNGQAKRQDQLFLDQQESIARINQMQEAGIVPSISSVFNSIEQHAKLQSEIEEASKTGDDNKVKELQYQMLNYQMSDALENGTVDKLEDVYKTIYNLDTEKAQNKGFDVDPKSPNYYKNKATEAINLINDVEDGYLNIANKGYINPDEILDSFIKDKTLTRLLDSHLKSHNNIHTEALTKKINLDIQADLNSEKPPKELTDLPEFQEYKISKMILDDIRSNIKSNLENYSKLTSKEHQDELFINRQNKIKEELEKSEIKAKEEENKEVKKRQKEVKKRVDEAEELSLKERSLEPVKNTKSITISGKEYELDLDTDEITNITDNVKLSKDGLLYRGAMNRFKPTVKAMPNAEEEVDIPNEAEVIDDNYNKNIEEYKPWSDFDVEKGIEMFEKDSGRYYSVGKIEAFKTYKGKADRIEAVKIGGKWYNNGDWYNLYTKNNITPSVTPEEKAVAKIVDQEEIYEKEKELTQDGLVLPSIDNIEKVKEVNDLLDFSFKRDVGNTIISLNINYVENILGDVDVKTNVYNIYDTYDENGNLIINDNFDSRLQSPNQFSKDTEVTIKIPSYQDMLDKGVQGYTENDYNNNINNVNSFPIAFYDKDGKIIGYLPTQDNVSKRVNNEYVENELIKNKELREFLFNNKDKNYNVVITNKSKGSLLTNQVNKNLYDALGNGETLANDVSIAVFKNGNLQTSLTSTFNESLVNRTDLQNGYVYSILPTAQKGIYIATPMEVSAIGTENAKAVLKLLQLYKANPSFDRDSELIKERDILEKDIDLNNYIEFSKAINSIMYISSDSNNDQYLFKITDKKLILGVTSDLIFDIADVMTNEEVQNNIINILSKRYHSVELSKLKGPFNEYKVNIDGKLEKIKHNKYTDYLNSNGVIKTNVQGFPVDREMNQMYFTGQSVIEFSNPIIKDNKKIESREPAPSESKSTKPSNKLGIKFKPKNNRQVEEDFNFISSQENKSIDKQAENLIKKCQG